MKRLIPILLLILLFNVASAQVNLYVDSSITASGTGAAWSSAYKTLNEALNVANAASITTKYVINIAKGTYYPVGIQSGTNRDSTFFIGRGGIKLYGGFPSGGGLRSASANPTVLNGNIGSALNSADNSYHIVVVAGIAAAADSIIMDGFTISDAYSYGSIGTKIFNSVSILRDYGGALHVTNVLCPLMTSNCIVTRNSTNSGGGVYVENSVIAISSCSYINNYAFTIAGGGLNCISSTLTMSYCNFSGNTSLQGGGINFENNHTSGTGPGSTISYCSFIGNAISGLGNSGGGGLANLAGNGCLLADVYNCSFTGNTAGYGGAVMLSASQQFTGLIRRCTFSANSAATAGGAVYMVTGYFSKVDSCIFMSNKAGTQGGGLYANSGLATIAQNLFMNDTAAMGGGMFCNISMTINNNRFINNTASQKGGGLYSYSANSDHVKDTFFANTAPSGGGIYLSQANGTFKNCIVSGNSASLSGGGFYLYSSGHDFTNCLISGNKAVLNGGAFYDTLSASPTITNCTLSSDTATNGNGIYNANGSSPTIKNSIIWEGMSGSVFNVLNSFPAITYSTVQGGYSGTGNISSNPLFTSPALASQTPTTAGIYTVLPCSPAVNAGLNAGSYTGVTDLAGNSRLFGTTVDMGAYELQLSYPTPITGNSSVCPGSTLQLSIANSGGTWTSSNPALATVNSSGLVTGIAAGTDTITYTNVGVTCPVTSYKIITVFPSAVTATIASTTTLCAGSAITLSNSTTGGIWSSSNPALATVSNGIVIGIASGLDTIRYTVTNATTGCTNSALTPINVYPKPVVPAITGPTLVCAKSSVQLSNAATGGVWSSSSTPVATVSSTGLATGVSGGTAFIAYTITSTNGCANAASHTLAVSQPVVAISGSNAVCINGTATLSGTPAGGAWKSINPAVATVNSSGLVSGTTVGSAVLRYTYTAATTGCTDSADQNIIVGPVYNIAASATTCQGTPYMFGGTPLTAGGTYTHRFASVLGCDSDVTMTLTVKPLDLTVTQSGNKLTANQAGATYQWISCVDGTPLTGETAQTFTAASTGTYAAIVTYNGCSDTTNCIFIGGLSVPGTPVQTQVKLFPNPTTGIVEVSALNAIVRTITVRDITGKRLQQAVPKSTGTRIDLSAYAPGTYLIEVTFAGTSQQRYIGRVSLIR